jgi:hypothetical protein
MTSDDSAMVEQIERGASLLPSLARTLPQVLAEHLSFRVPLIDIASHVPFGKGLPLRKQTRVFSNLQ